MTDDWTPTPHSSDRLMGALKEHITLKDIDPDPATDPIELEALGALMADVRHELRSLGEVYAEMDQAVDSELPIRAQLQDRATAITLRIEDAISRYRGQ